MQVGFVWTVEHRLERSLLVKRVERVCTIVLGDPGCARRWSTCWLHPSLPLPVHEGEDPYPVITVEHSVPSGCDGRATDP